MGKPLGVTTLLMAGVLAFAVWRAIQQDARPLRHYLHDVASPRIAAEGLHLERSMAGRRTLTLKASAVQAHREDVLELHGHVRLDLFDPPGQLQQSVEAHTGRAFFDGSLSFVGHPPELLRLEAADGVRLHRPDGFQLYTKALTFEASEGLLVGSEPVEVEAPGHWLRAATGFNMQVDTQRFELLGPVVGAFAPKVGRR